MGSDKENIYFLAALVNTFVAMGRGAFLYNALQHMQPITQATHHTPKQDIVLKVVHEPLLDAFEREGVAANYYRASGWGMDDA